MLRGAEAAQRAEGGLVGDLLLPAIDLHHAIAEQTLPEVLVGRHDPHLLDLVAEAPRAGGEPVVGLVLAHRPDHDAERAHRFLDRVELRAQLGGHAFVALVVGEEIVAERSDRVVERHRDVRHRFFGLVQAARAASRPRPPSPWRPSPRRGVTGPRRVVSAVELVGPVDEVKR